MYSTGRKATFPKMFKNEKAASLFESIATLPQIKSLETCSSGSDQFLLSLAYGTKDYSADRKEKLHQQLLIGKNGELILKGPYLSASEEEVDTIVDENFKISLISTGKDDKRFVKYYQHDGSISIINVTKEHGPFYTDCGLIAISPSRTNICYIAQPPAPEDDLKFHFRDDPGEGYTGRRAPVAILLNLATKKVQVLRFDSLYALSHPIFDPITENFLYFIGVQNLPTRLGIRYCTNRSSFLYKCNTDGTGLEKISGDFGNARFPLLTPNKEQIVFLSNQIGGPDDSCAKLVSYVLKTKKETLIVDSVKTAKSKFDFPGLFVNSGLQPHCWLDHSILVLNSLWRSKSAILAIDIRNGNIQNLTTDDDKSWSLLRVCGSQIFATCSDPSTFPQLATRSYGTGSGWKIIDTVPIPPPVQDLLKSFKHRVKELATNVEVILIEPSLPKKGLIVMPHGTILNNIRRYNLPVHDLGPHSCLTTSFSIACFTFLSQGLSILLVNYTGSTGFGDDSIYGLVGKIGSLEVSEVHGAALWAKNETKVTKVFVHGGSHGGFIAAHLVSQYPDFYAGAVIRNPVINVGGMPFNTDIPGLGFSNGRLVFCRNWIGI